MARLLLRQLLVSQRRKAASANAGSARAVDAGLLARGAIDHAGESY
jgi:hypothetical protein